MIKLITAINNPKLNEQLKQLHKYEIIAPDIQYQEGVYEILEKDKNIQILILSEILYGKNNFKEFIEKIKIINSKIKIIIILEKENQEKINYLKEKNIYNIFINNKFTIKNIIDVLEIENNSKKNIEEEIETIKNLILQNTITPKEERKSLNVYVNKFLKQIQEKKSKNIEENKPIIVTVAGSSGTGKSIVSSCLGVNIKQQNQKTLLLDFDILNNNIHTIFGKSILPKKAKKKINLNENNINIKNLKIKINKNLDLICAIKLLFENEKINLNKLNIILDELKKEYKTIIIDTSSECFFDYQKLLLEKSDKIIFLTDTNLLEIKKSINLLKIYIQEWKIEKEKINIIFNKYNKNSVDEKILKNIFKEFNILAKIKLNINYYKLINKNMNKIFLNKKINKEYKRIIKKLFSKKDIRKKLKKFKLLKGVFYGRIFTNSKK